LLKEKQQQNWWIASQCLPQAMFFQLFIILFSKTLTQLIFNKGAMNMHWKNCILINGAGKTACAHAEEWSCTPISHQKSTLNGLES
jgi:hypothetical protein